ncbi:putative Nitrogen regulatory protein [uncultured spirochete]|jgi:PTS system nitrogen regulatory IIA component|uniref:Putative Nitrogen regulatory protein n=1 Tax=uncultured spirochete TaxID=156406 RepID=A0A3P3XN92_9SPIR|nr:putative Nitrogen regulatory protein [uncultured spirochete]
MQMLLDELIAEYDPWYLVDPESMPKALGELLRALPLPKGLDRDALLDALLGREEVMSTAIGNGIAIPHVRQFGSESLQKDIVVVAYLFEPLDWKAPDGQLVHTLFLVLAADETRHLQILAEIARLASDEDFVAFLKTMPDRAALVERMRQME